jgi:hypothetical protein
LLGKGISFERSIQMTTAQHAPSTLEFRCPSDGYQEQIPIELMREAISALPDGHRIRRRLIEWTQATPDTEVVADELSDAEQQLLEFAHDSRGESGLVGRLPRDAAGRIVGAERQDEVTVSATVVLALAIQRLRLLGGVGTQVVFAGASTG